MKKLILTFIIVMILPVSAFAENKTDTANQKAVLTIEEGLTFMESTISEQNIEEMFNGGPIMSAWHEKAVTIGEAMEGLDAHAQTLNKEAGGRLQGVQERLTEIMNDFHIATHNKDKAAAEKEVSKAKSALKLLKVLVPDDVKKGQ